MVSGKHPFSLDVGHHSLAQAFSLSLLKRCCFVTTLFYPFGCYQLRSLRIGSGASRAPMADVPVPPTAEGLSERSGISGSDRSADRPDGHGRLMERQRPPLESLGEPKEENTHSGSRGRGRGHDKC